MNKTILKDTENVIIWYDNNTGMINYKFKIKDNSRIIEGVK